MTNDSPIQAPRLDRVGIALSGLCALHCIGGLLLVASVGAGGSFFLNPLFHEIGLLVATVIAGIAIGLGAIKHRRRKPFVVAMTGLSFMGGALAMDHGVEEAVLTVIGVVLVAAGHFLNLRGAR
ncbi:MerC domain-containing protein [Paraurantiacibacter namhicola]|uniref:MerC domain-containing protein n=1 Tax=Paraurantiacibacter namhicola TaxID=645517 RepID=UPI001F20EF82|nr:MerC domain-containing protein [Paraurantiacibacter namhicola]